MQTPQSVRGSPWVVLIPLAAIVLNHALFPGYTGDDAFIHFTYVRNLVERGLVAYNGPVPSYGSSSILWVLLGACVSWPVGHVPETMRVLGAGLWGLAVLLAVDVVHRRAPLPLAGRLLVALVLVANAVVFRWMATGMETGLVCLVSVLILRFADPARPIRLSLLCLAALLTRPEFVILPVCLLLAWRRPFVSRKRDGVVFVAGTLALFTVWFLCAQLYFGRPMPMTAVKSVGWLDISSTVRIAKIVAGTFPAAFAACALMVFGGGSRRGGRRGIDPVDTAFLAFGIMLLGFYLITGTNIISRYLTVIALPFAVFCATQISTRWLQDGRIRWQAWGIVALFLVVEAGAFRQLHAAHISTFTEGFQQAYAAMGHRLERTTPEDTAAVMAGDVGYVGYYSRRRIIDVAGLTSTHIYDAGTRDDSTLIARYHPGFIIIRETDERLPGFEQMITRASGSPGDIRVLYRTRIPPLGVMADPASWWQVELCEVTYGGEKPAPPSGGKESVPNSSQRQAR